MMSNRIVRILVVAAAVLLVVTAVLLPAQCFEQWLMPGVRLSALILTFLFFIPENRIVSIAHVSRGPPSRSPLE